MTAWMSLERNPNSSFNTIIINKQNTQNNLYVVSFDAIVITEKSFMKIQ